MSDFDAQRLLNIIDERIKQHLDAGLSYHHGVVASVSTSPQTCQVYLYGATDTSGGFFWSSECYPEVGDTVRVAINRTTGDRWVDAVVSRSNLVLPTVPDYPLPILWAYRSGTDQAISTSTTTTVAYNAVQREDDESSLLSHNTGTGECTVAEAGWYQIDAGVHWGAGSSGNRRILIAVNGSDYAAETHPATPNTNRSAISRRIYLAASDVVVVHVWHDNGSDVNVNASEMSYLVVSHVRP